MICSRCWLISGVEIWGGRKHKFSNLGGPWPPRPPWFLRLLLYCINPVDGLPQFSPIINILITCKTYLITVQVLSGVSASYKINCVCMHAASKLDKHLTVYFALNSDMLKSISPGILTPNIQVLLSSYCVSPMMLVT